MIVFTVPLRLPSASNLREHWTQRDRRVKSQRRAIALKCPPWNEGPLVRVHLVRIAPRFLDDDNLRGALKAVRDSVASRLRVDDASPLVRFTYAQEKGPEPSVRVSITRAEQSRHEEDSDEEGDEVEG